MGPKPSSPDFHVPTTKQPKKTSLEAYYEALKRQPSQAKPISYQKLEAPHEAITMQRFEQVSEDQARCGCLNCQRATQAWGLPNAKKEDPLESDPMFNPSHLKQRPIYTKAVMDAREAVNDHRQKMLMFPYLANGHFQFKSADARKFYEDRDQERREDIRKALRLAQNTLLDTESRRLDSGPANFQVDAPAPLVGGARGAAGVRTSRDMPSWDSTLPIYNGYAQEDSRRARIFWLAANDPSPKCDLAPAMTGIKSILKPHSHSRAQSLSPAKSARFVEETQVDLYRTESEPNCSRFKSEQQHLNKSAHHDGITAHPGKVLRTAEKLATRQLKSSKVTGLVLCGRMWEGNIPGVDKETGELSIEGEGQVTISRSERAQMYIDLGLVDLNGKLLVEYCQQMV
ncbi:MAG: hypothetical protein M1828_002534 [Chrysothrix sp. TS-e1954]|nr:MAG: hypothetical protein M1828_002534 [Chrysothrix sp. TS-e1954]